MVELSIWIAAMASLVILAAAIRLYQVHHLEMPLPTRIFFASIAASAIYSLFEILAWRRPLPVGMTMFLVLLAAGWAMRAFTRHCLLPAIIATARAHRPAPQRDMSQDQPVFSYRRNRAQA